MVREKESTKGIEFHELESWKWIYNPNKRKEYKLVERIKRINLLCSGNNRVFCLGLLIDDKGDTNKEKDFKIKNLVIKFVYLHAERLRNSLIKA